MTDNIINLAERRPQEPEDKRVMCEIVVYANGDATTWVNNDMISAEQFNWLLAKLAGVGGSLYDEKIQRTGFV